MQPEDVNRYALWQSIEQFVNANQRLNAMSDAEIADLLLKVWGEKVTFSLEETVLSNVRERLKRAGGGTLAEDD